MRGDRVLPRCWEGRQLPAGFSRVQERTGVGGCAGAGACAAALGSKDARGFRDVARLIAVLRSKDVRC